MKNIKQLFWIPSLTLLITGCAVPQVNHRDPQLSEWQTYGEMLPPTGMEPNRIYAAPQPANYPATQPNILIDQNGASGDAALADSIRHEVEYNRGLSPSLDHVVIVVQNGRLILQGSVKSDLDARVIVDDLRDIIGVTQISNQMQINPNID